MSETALGITGLNVSLGGRQVLTDVSLRLTTGRIHGLLGPNGAGKTTLFRAIMRLIPASGAIETPGGVGYVPQRHDVMWDFPITAQEVVMTGLTKQIGWLRWPKRRHYEAVAEALGRVRMTDLRNRPISEMSGGQRQRVMIARALARRPQLLLLDEPFTGLDMPTQELLTALFRGLAEDGTTLFMSTHDLTHAMVVCDEVTLVNRRVVASGEPARLRDAEAWKRTFEVSDQSPLLKQVGLAGAGALLGGATC
ncbi:anchored repeat-type ABC transporter ATP-binding subunit [Tessaracoccus sp. OH4464_COT-324]|uniref:anchored repeat-type ABC transporter ATP-binding subunit n=1 Tax=Tessaracoccus sp. OH4464_COT-324 TaxID=2491059 RepID=UPI000F62E884|nr:anchored repeat-type ABC transporter ATP-binding subunit [Tessaracoccus sp. OH4464_COT-324]RRD45200.1 anchored repeat-type ABC transporter ATP-binding subunit [Tessaracoccus sp. OH4464_COT-324]